MTVTAKVIADSIADGCPRITTLQLRYPRYIHAEFMTHRAFSRNSSSSRAIPVERLIMDVERDPAMPIHWGSNKAGMQAGDEIDGTSLWMAKLDWQQAMENAVDMARRMARTGLHKQHVNRILEPFQKINVLVTATEWDNFFALRDHPDAQPEIAELARAMRVAMGDSEPQYLNSNQWHLPYIDGNDRVPGGKLDEIGYLRKISAARCASVSYKTVDGKLMTVDKALAIYDKLLGDPLHASPFEHIAKPCPDNDKSKTRNFTGWAQYRAELEG